MAEPRTERSKYVNVVPDDAGLVTRRHRARAFELARARPRILFGAGAVAEVGAIARARWVTHALLVTGTLAPRAPRRSTGRSRGAACRWTRSPSTASRRWSWRARGRRRRARRAAIW